MRTRSKHAKILAGALAACYCAAALAQTTGGAQGTTPASQPNPTPASRATPTPASPPTAQQRNDQTQFPASARQDNRANSAQQAPLSRCAALTGIPRAECERRDAPDTHDLPAGVTQAQMERQAQREAEAARDTRARSSSTDTMRAPPASAPATSTSTPAPSAPAPAGTPRDDSDALNRPRD